MPPRYLLVLLLLVFPVHYLLAQAMPYQQEVRRIDSLVLYGNNEEAQQRIDSIVMLLRKSRMTLPEKELELKLLLHSANIQDRSERAPQTIDLTLYVIDEAHKYNLPEKEYRGYLATAIMFELSGDFDNCKLYIDKAYNLYKKHKLDHIYSTYCVRRASYYRFMKKKDSVSHYATLAIDAAKKYHNHKDYMDGCLLLGSTFMRTNTEEAVKYFRLAVHAALDMHDYDFTAVLYSNISTTYRIGKQYDKALQYSDSAKNVFNSHLIPLTTHFYSIRSRIFRDLGNVDSAFFYFEKYHLEVVASMQKSEAAQIRQISDKYQYKQKEEIIKTKNLQITFGVCIVLIIGITSALLIRKNRKINAQNKIISKQLEELMRTLEQKQVLLSELQHRVKNNLQHVISILEIQKESVDFNNIEELIRGNQNRIHSMALLHKKLNIAESVNEVDLEKYIPELSELVHNSYSNHEKKIKLSVVCDQEKISIEKALPLGLIIVELVSNSMKHAFKKRQAGSITIRLTREKENKLLLPMQLHYEDDGVGFDFNTANSKGLGMEIIKGLIGQLGATIESSYRKGFKLTLHFK